VNLNSITKSLNLDYLENGASNRNSEGKKDMRASSKESNGALRFTIRPPVWPQIAFERFRKNALFTAPEKGPNYRPFPTRPTSAQLP
jgi:hypothetical protein